MSTALDNLVTFEILDNNSCVGYDTSDFRRGLALGVATVLNIGTVEAVISFIIGREIFPPDVYGLQGLPAELDWAEAIFTTLWAMAMSILVTVWPAWSAAKLDPVEALRFG